MHTLDDWCWHGYVGWLPLGWWGMTGMAGVTIEIVGRRLGLRMGVVLRRMGVVLRRMGVVLRRMGLGLKRSRLRLALRWLGVLMPVGTYLDLLTCAGIEVGGAGVAVSQLRCRNGVLGMHSAGVEIAGGLGLRLRTSR